MFVCLFVSFFVGGGCLYLRCWFFVVVGLFVGGVCWFVCWFVVHIVFCVARVFEVFCSPADSKLGQVAKLFFPRVLRMLVICLKMCRHLC